MSRESREEREARLLRRSIVAYHFRQGWTAAIEQENGKHRRHAVDQDRDRERHWRSGYEAGRLAFEVLARHYVDDVVADPKAYEPAGDWRGFVHELLQADMLKIAGLLLVVLLGACIRTNPDLEGGAGVDLVEQLPDLGGRPDLVRVVTLPDLSRAPAADLREPPADLTSLPDLRPAGVDLAEPPACGGTGEACCSGSGPAYCLGSSDHCYLGTCEACGGFGEPCCGGDAVTHLNGWCVGSFTCLDATHALAGHCN